MIESVRRELVFSRNIVTIFMQYQINENSVYIEFFLRLLIFSSL